MGRKREIQEGKKDDIEIERREGKKKMKQREKNERQRVGNADK